MKKNPAKSVTGVLAAAVCLGLAAPARAFWTEGGLAGGSLEQLGLSAGAELNGPQITPGGDSLMPAPAPANAADPAGERARRGGMAGSLTLMFYLNNQNDDHVDGYVMEHYRKLAVLARKYESVRFLFILDKAKLNAARPANSDELSIETMEAGLLVQLEKIRNRNFADAEVLERFLTLGLQYGSGTNVLVMSDHGDADLGLMTTSFPDPASLTGKISEMKLGNAAAAIDKACGATGRKLDLLVLDACIMGNIEALSELARAKGLRFVVASENATIPSFPSTGVPVAEIIGAILAGGRGPDPKDIGSGFINGTKSNTSADLGLFDLEAMRTSFLPGDMNEYSTLLARNPLLVKKVLAVLNLQKRSPNIGYFFTDFKALINAVTKVSGSAAWKAKNDAQALIGVGEKLLADIETFQLAFETDKKDVFESGLTIRTSFQVPSNPDAVKKIKNNYGSLVFPENTKWDLVIDELDRSRL